MLSVYTDNLFHRQLLNANEYEEFIIPNLIVHINDKCQRRDIEALHRLVHLPSLGLFELFLVLLDPSLHVDSYVKSARMMKPHSVHMANILHILPIGGRI